MYKRSTISKRIFSCVCIWRGGEGKAVRRASYGQGRAGLCWAVLWQCPGNLQSETAGTAASWSLLYPSGLTPCCRFLSPCNLVFLGSG
uniref:Uncharacterized protein n=1 Tax=Anguilla anguilla TaxID=7936 RepID=A0A0E9WK26_ANGAN